MRISGAQILQYAFGMDVAYFVCDNEISNAR